jgi:hypothetical protein
MISYPRRGVGSVSSYITLRDEWMNTNSEDVKKNKNSMLLFFTGSHLCLLLLLLFFFFELELSDRDGQKQDLPVTSPGSLTISE